MHNTWIWGSLLLAALPAVAEPADPYLVTVPVLDPAPKIDGTMSPGEWDGAVLLDRFQQLAPDEGAPATEPTEVRLGYDAKNLYVGVRCFDSQADQIVANAMDRDGELINEDSVKMVFDTFLDNKNGFYFAVNPLGVEVDALLRNEGDEVNYAWDGVWDVRTSRDDGGWTAEIVIPFHSLRFPKSEDQTWGFNFERVMATRREYLIWKPVIRYAATDPLHKVSQYGRLTGLHGLEQGRSFDLKPYGLLRANRGDTVGHNVTFDAGLDFKSQLTSNLVADLTYNLDFAEAEADQQQVNLTRFPLYFSEKRDFFLEGANLFFIGERPDGLRNPDRIFFFSRRIGLSDDGSQQIPVLGGAKISGKLGQKLGLGFLNLTTDDLSYSDRDGERQLAPQTNYTVLRLKQDVLEKSSIGIMGLNKAVDGGPDNSGAAVDWDFGFGDVRTGGYYAQTSTDNGPAGHAANADVLWDSRFAFLRAEYTDVSDDFDPEMGFFSRTGIKEYRGVLTFTPRPKIWNLRDVYIINDFYYVTNQQDQLDTRVDHFEIDLQWKNFVVVSIKAFDNTEVLDSDFEIHPGVIVPAGRHDYQNYFLGAQTIPSKPYFGFVQLRFGEFYDGDYHTSLFGARIRPVRGMFARIAWEHDDINLPAGDFTVDLYSLKLIYSFTPRLSTRTQIEWNRQDNVTANFLLRWIYKPGASVYLAYNEFDDLSDLGATVHVDDRSLIAKVGFLF
jgi:Domain of unknown function (DUF5916)/Carbohydrate family 9 binding domain-like